MTKRQLILFIPAMLAACGSATQDAERSYQTITKAGGTYAEACVAAKRVAAAWAADGNTEKYQIWSGYAETDCSIAASCREYGPSCQIGSKTPWDRVK